jgi:hypothetical protein
MTTKKAFMAWKRETKNAFMACKGAAALVIL